MHSVRVAQQSFISSASADSPRACTAAVRVRCRQHLQRVDSGSGVSVREVGRVSGTIGLKWERGRGQRERGREVGTGADYRF